MLINLLHFTLAYMLQQKHSGRFVMLCACTSHIRTCMLQLFLKARKMSKRFLHLIRACMLQLTGAQIQLSSCYLHSTRASMLQPQIRTNMKCAYGFYVCNFYLIECICCLIIQALRILSRFMAVKSPVYGANTSTVLCPLHIRTDDFVNVFDC